LFIEPSVIFYHTCIQKGTIAKPLPKTKAPALPKNRKIFHKTESVESKIVMFRKANERELKPNDLGGNL
jgi:hypothetical protein